MFCLVEIKWACHTTYFNLCIFFINDFCKAIILYSNYAALNSLLRSVDALGVLQSACVSTARQVHLKVACDRSTLLYSNLSTYPAPSVLNN